MRTPLPLSGPPDAELVERVRSGDRNEYAQLVERYQERLFRYALGMVRESDAAADLVQDAFVKAYTGLSTCRDPERFGAWIFRILRNRCADYLKEHRRRDISLDVRDDYASATDLPERDLERREMGEVIDRALATLPSSHREAFLLKHVEELSYEEMSDLLGVGISALKMRVARSREALRAAIREIGHELEREM